MKNETKFNEFLENLKETNSTLKNFTDFKKCEENLEKISIHLHTLNFLLNKNNLKSAIQTLFAENIDCFSILNLLIAVRDKKQKLINQNRQIAQLKDYFKDPQKIYEFFVKLDLIKFFKAAKLQI